MQPRLIFLPPAVSQIAHTLNACEFFVTAQIPGQSNIFAAETPIDDPAMPRGNKDIHPFRAKAHSRARRGGEQVQ